MFRRCKKNNEDLGGKGKLTAKLTDELSTYYRLAIRRNVNFIEDMFRTVWATLCYKSSTIVSTKHHYCPEDPNS